MQAICLVYNIPGLDVVTVVDGFNTFDDGFNTGGVDGDAI